MWKDRTHDIQTKIKLKTLEWPVALYGSESWTLKANDIDKLKAFEMTLCYRRMLRISWTERRTSESVLKEIGMDRQLVAMQRNGNCNTLGT